MTYQETIDYLFHVTPVFEKVGAGAYKEGLSNTWAMDEHFGHPHRQFKTIHVAGTNGKGSCSHTIAAILQSAGYIVGLYTSPHLVDFRERIRVNGLMVSEEYVIDFVENERAFFEPLHPSFFELTTAMAFKYFAEQHVDIAVIELVLGGRLDCTNILTPALSIITNISVDHTQVLGNTLAESAAEKAGIIKQGVPVVVGETTPETLPVFEAKAQEVHAPLHLAEQYEPDCDYDFELKGSYQDKNKRTILCAMHCLQELLEMDDVHGAIAQGMAHVCELTGLVGRWQTLRQQPLVVCDTGHNVGGWTYLSEQIKAQKCRQLRIVFGMVDDKDINTVMEMLPKDAVYYFTQASTHRAIPVGKVMEYATSHGLRGNGFNNVKDAYHQALQDASTEDFIFVGGSSYVVADLLAI